MLNINPTIAIIDSGIGGVAVLKQIIAKFNAGNYIYFADNLFMPYGNKTKSWLKKRVEHLINLMLTTYHADHVIIACNTASTLFIDSNFPNVTKMEFDETKTYFATNLTKQNLPSLRVIADKTLAKEVEKNILNPKLLKNTVKSHIKKCHLDDLSEYVLGCTHYELVKDIFTEFCPNTNIVCNSTLILDKLDFKFAEKELNIVFMFSKKDLNLENKILKILRS